MIDRINREGSRALFESMPEQFLNRQSENLHTQPSLTPSERREAVEWLLSPEGGHVTVKLFPPYDSEQIRESLVESMLLNEWFLPDTRLENRIPLQGISLHHVGSSTIPLVFKDSNDIRKINVVVKPFVGKYSKAESELKKFFELEDRGISTIEPFALISVKDALAHNVYEMTVLRKGLVPVSKIHFDQLQQESHQNQRVEVMESLAHFLAFFHDSGVAHGDLHLGNIAMDMNQIASHQFVVLDLERSSIMSSLKLRIKNRLSVQITPVLERKFKKFENLIIKDIATIAADLKVNNPNLDHDFIVHHLIVPYLRARINSYGRQGNEEFMREFDACYKVKFPLVQRINEWRQRQSDDINLTSNSNKTF